METKEVFISYKSEEFEEALWVKNVLEDNGISCWMAPMCITGGASYASEIPAAINNCKAFVLILSNNAQQSRWVPRELDQAINANKVILPFMLEECELNDEFSFYLSNVQRYTAYLDRDGSMKKMLKEIKELIAKANAEEAKKAEEKERLEKEKLERERASQQNTEETPEQPAAPTKEKVAPPTEPKAEKKSKAKPTSSKKKGGKKSLFIVLAALVALIVGIVVFSKIYEASQTVVIAGEKFKKSDFSVTLSEKEITEDDIKAFAQFEELGIIRISDSTFKTGYLTEFANHKLYQLTLENCNLTDSQLKSIDFKKLVYLNDIDLSGNTNLTDVSVIIPTAEKLEKLDIGNTGVKNIDFIATFEKVEILSIEGLGISSLSPLNQLVYLKKLFADNNALESLDGIENTTILEEVSLSGNQLVNVNNLENSAETLRVLNLSDNKLTDLSLLSVCKNLTKFSANNNSLVSLEFLSECASLSNVSANGNLIESTKGLKGVLTNVSLSGNKLTSVEGLTFDTDYSVYVDFSDNDITSLELPKDCKYNVLNLKGNAFADNAFYEGLKGYTIEIDYFEELSSELLKELDFSTINLYECPANRKVEFETAAYKIKLS